MRNLLAKTAVSVLLLLFASNASAGEWWNDEWEYRVEVRVKTGLGPDTELAHVRFPAAMNIVKGGADVRVVADGEVIPRTVMWAAPGEMCGVVFKLVKKTRTYYVYYGNPEAKDPGGAVDVSDLLTLEVWDRPQGPNNTWEQYKKLYDSRKNLHGRGVRATIWDGFNPYGPSRNFLSVYRGRVICKQAGEYTFATASDDSSFLFIDGRLVVQWPGSHGAQAGTWGRYSGKITLEKGTHKIEYYHESGAPGQAAVAGWKPPGAERLGLLREYDFVRPKKGNTVRFERRGREVTALFSYRKLSSIQTSGESFFFFKMKDRSSVPRSGAEYAWDFGDGTTSSAKEPEHVFGGEQRFKVTLTVKTDKGTDSVVRIVDTRVLFLDTQRIHQAKYLRVAEDYDIEKMSADAAKRFAVLYDLADWFGHMARCFRVVLNKDSSLSDKTWMEYRYKLATALFEEGVEAEAGKIFREISERRVSKYIAANARLGLARTTLFNNSTDARAAAEKVIADFGENYRTICRKAEILIGDTWRVEGDRAKAKAAYERSEEYRVMRGDEKASKAGYYAQTAEHYIHQKYYRWALKIVRAWEEEYPLERLTGYTATLKARAWCGLKKYDLALREMETLVKACPSSNHAPGALMITAEIYANKKDFAKAKAALGRIVSDYPESAEVVRAKKLMETLNRK